MGRREIFVIFNILLLYLNLTESVRLETGISMTDNQVNLKSTYKVLCFSSK